MNYLKILVLEEKYLVIFWKLPFKNLDEGMSFKLWQNHLNNQRNGRANSQLSNSKK